MNFTHRLLGDTTANQTVSNATVPEVTHNVPLRKAESEGSPDGPKPAKSSGEAADAAVDWIVDSVKSSLERAKSDLEKYRGLEKSFDNATDHVTDPLATDALLQTAPKHMRA